MKKSYTRKLGPQTKTRSWSNKETTDVQSIQRMLRKFSFCGYCFKDLGPQTNTKGQSNIGMTVKQEPQKVGQSQYKW